MPLASGKKVIGRGNVQAFILLDRFDFTRVIFKGLTLGYRIAKNIISDKHEPAQHGPYHGMPKYFTKFVTAERITSTHRLFKRQAIPRHLPDEASGTVPRRAAEIRR